MTTFTNFDINNIPAGATVEEAARRATPPTFKHVPDVMSNEAGYWERSAKMQGINDIEAFATLYPEKPERGLRYSIFDQPTELTPAEMREYIADLNKWWAAEEQHLVYEEA